MLDPSSMESALIVPEMFPIGTFPLIFAAVASISSCPPAVLPSWTLIELLVVLTETSPAAPVNELFCAVVPLLNCTVTVSYTHLTLPTILLV